MKRLMVLSIALSILLLGAEAVKHRAYAEDVKVGAILPLSGPLSSIGQHMKNGFEYVVNKELNGQGGIKSMGGSKIRMIYTDSRGDPKIGLSEAERLIVQENVSVLTGAFQSSVTLTSSQVAERYKVPFLNLIAVADAITERGFKYTFRISEKASWTGKDIMGFLDYMGKKAGKPVKTLGLLYENSDWGQSSAKSWRKYAKDYGFEIIVDEAYPHGTTDMTPMVLKFKKINPDAMCNASYLADEILLVRTLVENRWKPKVIVTAGGGEVMPEFFKAVGDLAENHFCALPASDDILEVKPWAKKVAQDFKKEMGPGAEFMNSIMPYSIMHVLMDALERAGSSDREKIREALSKTNITSGRALVLPYEKIVFDANGQNPNAPLFVCQIQKRKIRAVYPPYVVVPGIKATWPLPPME